MYDIACIYTHIYMCVCFMHIESYRIKISMCSNTHVVNKDQAWFNPWPSVRLTLIRIVSWLRLTSGRTEELWTRNLAQMCECYVNASFMWIQKPVHHDGVRTCKNGKCMCFSFHWISQQANWRWYTCWPWDKGPEALQDIQWQVTNRNFLSACG